MLKTKICSKCEYLIFDFLISYFCFRHTKMIPVKIMERNKRLCVRLIVFIKRGKSRNSMCYHCIFRYVKKMQIILSTLRICIKKYVNGATLFGSY